VKRVFSVLLCMTMLLSLCACGGAAGSNPDGAATTEAAAGGFRVGYGKANITPTQSVIMGGYGHMSSRFSKGVLSYLWVTCVAISDADDNTILLYGMDLLGTSSIHEQKRTLISDATGVPKENIVLSASHTHSAPSYTSQAPGLQEAIELLDDGLVEAARTAMEDRKPARMYGGKIKTEGLNFVRHYLMKDGTYAGDNFGDKSSGYAGHAHDADPELQMIKFTREGDNDVYIANFQTHPHQTGGGTKTDLSADVVGEFRANMEKDLGCEIAYFSGAGGNINSRSRIESENTVGDWHAWGVKMTEYAKQVEYTELKVGKVQAQEFDFEAIVNHDDDAYAALCSDLYSRWNKNEITTDQLKEIGLKNGIVLQSAYHASGIASRAALGRSKSFVIGAYSFGDVGFVSASYEMFDTNGVFIKENSPFAMTVIATSSNGGNGYFPSLETFEYGSYETNTSKYEAGTAERLADQFVKMLEEQFANK